jgi:hypothetical protein
MPLEQQNSSALVCERPLLPESAHDGLERHELTCVSLLNGLMGTLLTGVTAAVSSCRPACMQAKQLGGQHHLRITLWQNIRLS